jgi:hypothetical protein
VHILLKIRASQAQSKNLQHAAVFIATNLQQECSSVKLYHHNPKL